jgi:flagellar motor switch/type III secretory pathway protein FliN
MIPRPYRLFGVTEQQNAIRQVSKELVEWTSEWMVAGNQAPNVEVIPLSDILQDGMHWELAGEHDVPFVAVGYSGTWQRQLLGLLLGDLMETQPESLSDRIADALALQVVRALAERLLMAAGLLEAANADSWAGVPPLDVGQPGSPYLALRCVLSPGTALGVLLYPELLDAWVDAPEDSAREPIQPAAQTFDNEQVNLEIIIGEGELTIEELGTLATGDVIPLDRKLSQEISIRLAGNVPVCSGFLGSVHGKMAVQVAAKR